MYKSNDNAINTFFTDREFDCLKHAVHGINVDTSTQNEHVGDIEGVVRTVNERIWDIRSGLPFYILPSKMLIKIVAFTLMWFNAFSLIGGVSATYSPRNIITGSQLDYNKHCCLGTVWSPRTCA